MNANAQTKEIIERQFNELICKAKQLYPDINQDISSYSNIAAKTERLQDYLNLTMLTPHEISTNQTIFM